MMNATASTDSPTQTLHGALPIATVPLAAAPPIGGGIAPAAEALTLGAALSIFGVAYLALATNLLSAALAAVTIVIYIFGYTPLKRTSTANTPVGAIRGAIPPMIGRAARAGPVAAAA